MKEEYGKWSLKEILLYSEVLSHGASAEEGVKADSGVSEVLRGESRKPTADGQVRDGQFGHLDEGVD